MKNTQRTVIKSTLGARLVLLGLLIAFAAGRWGSYIGVGIIGVSISDVLFATGLSMYLLHGSSPGKLKQWPVLFALAVSTVVIVGFFRTPQMSMLAIRDAVPFLYILFIPAIAGALSSLDRDLIRQWILKAAIFHTAWFLPTSFGLMPRIDLSPLFAVPIFTPRGDFDAMISGLCIVIAICFRKTPTGTRYILGVAAAAAVLANGSRAGLLAGIIAVLICLLLTKPWANARTGPGLVVATCVSAATGLVFFILDLIPTGWSRVLAKTIPSDSPEYASAINTLNARLDAWPRVTDYVQSLGADHTGLGFGTSYLKLSGAIRLLSGETAVRHPHNFIVSWYAMLGIAGLIIMFVALSVVFIAARSCYGKADLQILGWAAVPAILVISAGGVVMESPFGYQTFVLAAALLFVVDSYDTQNGNIKRAEPENTAAHR